MCTQWLRFAGFFTFLLNASKILRFSCRLHREALRQSATDPLSGTIDVNIITTGVSLAARQRRALITDALKKIFEKAGKKTLNYQKVYLELKENSQNVSYNPFNLSRRLKSFIFTPRDIKFRNVMYYYWIIFNYTY